MTERIRWSDEPGETLGYVGTFDRPAFRIWPPDEEGDRILLVYLAGDGQHMHHNDSADSLGELKAKAERLLAEFVSSLGAIFPSSAGLKAERASWPSDDELAEMSRHDQEAWERRCAEVEAAEVARRLDEPGEETGQ
jgi:hypothetical protein